MLHTASKKSTAREKFIVTTVEQLAGITSQHNEIVKRLANGSLDVDQVRKGLQAIIEKRTEVRPLSGGSRLPSWYRLPGEQLERACHLFPGVSIPSPPISFMGFMPRELLLLHVPDTFERLWDRVEAPKGYTKYTALDLRRISQNLQFATGKRVYREPVWLAFDPAFACGRRPDSLWGMPQLAASEVLSALIQFPDWCLSWFGDAPAPSLTGYIMRADGRHWADVPYLTLSSSEDRLELDHIAAEDDGYLDWASPTVREC